MYRTIVSNYNCLILELLIVIYILDSRLGSIVSKNCVKRVLKVKKLPTPPPSTVKGKSSFFMSKTDSSSSVEKSEKPESKVL